MEMHQRNILNTGISEIYMRLQISLKKFSNVFMKNLKVETYDGMKNCRYLADLKYVKC